MFKLHWIAISIFIGLLLGFLYVNKSQVQEYETLMQEQNHIKVTFRYGPPKISQESIDIALLAFQIRIPSHVNQPKLDLTLEDRGVTSGAIFSNYREVRIGPAAFTSWGILASTLSHEIEVHVKQSFFKIVMQDEIDRIKNNLVTLAAKNFPNIAIAKSDKDRSPQGTSNAEKEAYEYELKNAERFQLTREEQKSIKEVMNFYYLNKEL